MNTGNSRGWARSPQSVALIAAALAISSILGTSFLLIQHFRPSVSSLEHPTQPLTDDQARAQVVDPAKRIVTAAQLREVTGGYILMSCRDAHDPPYQGAVYLTFELPGAGDSDALVYLRRIGEVLIADGWSQGAPPNEHLFGHTLTKDGVTVIFYRNSERGNVGTMQLYGECRNTSDHTGDATGWTDVTGQLR